MASSPRTTPVVFPGKFPGIDGLLEDKLMVLEDLSKQDYAEIKKIISQITEDFPDLNEEFTQNHIDDASNIKKAQFTLGLFYKHLSKGFNIGHRNDIDKVTEISYWYNVARMLTSQDEDAFQRYFNICSDMFKEMGFFCFVDDSLKQMEIFPFEIDDAYRITFNEI